MKWLFQVEPKCKYIDSLDRCIDFFEFSLSFAKLKTNVMQYFFDFVTTHGFILLLQLCFVTRASTQKRMMNVEETESCNGVWKMK